MRWRAGMHSSLLFSFRKICSCFWGKKNPESYLLYFFFCCWNRSLHSIAPAAGRLLLCYVWFQASWKKWGQSRISSALPALVPNSHKSGSLKDKVAIFLLFLLFLEFLNKGILTAELWVALLCKAFTDLTFWVVVEINWTNSGSLDAKLLGIFLSSFPLFFFSPPDTFCIPYVFPLHI